MLFPVLLHLFFYGYLSDDLFVSAGYSFPPTIILTEVEAYVNTVGSAAEKGEACPYP